MTCQLQEILGNFPIIEGMTCSDYALMISLTSIVSSFVFWSQVTK